MTDQLIMEENGKRYRMLQVGETLEAGDEVNIVHREGWQPFDFTLIHWDPFVVGADRNGPMPVGFYRRPIQ